MEKFTTWEDKSSGINPFVPSRREPSGLAFNLLGSVLAMIRLVLLVPVFGGAMIAATLATVLGPLGFVLDFAVGRPLTRFSLFIMGYLWAEEAVLDQRRLRLGKLSKKGMEMSKNATLRFGTTIRGPQDIIIFNFASAIEILYLYSRFGAEFAFPVVSSSDENAVGYAHVKLFGALRRATFTGFDTSEMPANISSHRTLAEIQTSARAPVALAAEGVRTNGKAILKFSKTMYSDRSLKTDKIRAHIIGFQFPSKTWTPCNPVSGILATSFWSCFHIRTRLSVNLVPYELWTAETESRSKGSDEYKQEETQNAAKKMRTLLATSVGSRGVKLVDLGTEESFDFQRFFFTGSSNMKQALHSKSQ